MTDPIVTANTRYLDQIALLRQSFQQLAATTRFLLFTIRNFATSWDQFYLSLTPVERKRLRGEERYRRRYERIGRQRRG